MAQLLTGTRIYGTGTVDTQLFVSGTNSATSTTTGALQVVGGVGIGGNLYVGGTIFGGTLSGTASTATNADNIKTVLQTSSASHYLAFVDSNNSTAGYEALYTTSSLTINPSTGDIVVGRYITASRYVGTLSQAYLDVGATNVTLNGDANDYFLYNRASNFWQFVIASTERMRIDSSGTVGIGFTAPNGKLDVAGDLYVGATQNTARFKSDGTDTFVDAIPGSGAVVIRAGGSVEKLRVTANGGISFGASGTAYGVSGQILQSNGDAAPTWISTGSLAAANATTATHLSGGVAGQIPYQTAPGVTSFLSTGTAGNVLVSNGSSAPTYNNTLTLTGTTAATSTTTGALQVVGGFGLGGDLFIRGDIATNDTTFNLINSTATTVNFAGAATTLTMGASSSGTTNVRNNLTVSGNLTVQGTTTIVDSTVTNIADPILTLGGGTGNSAPTADDNKDRGVAFKWVNNGGTTSTGFFGYDDSTGYFTYVQTATITNEVVSGTKGAMDVNLAGGTAMSIVYQSSQDNTAFLAATTSGYLLQTNGTGSAPSWVNASGVSAGSATYADNVRTIAQAASASYYPTFVDSNNASNAYESVYTTSSFYINPATGAVNVTGTITASSSVTASGTGASGGFRLHTNSGITASNNYMNFFTGQTTGWSFNANGTGADTNQVAYITASGGAYFAGNVGIGTTSTGAKLDVQAGDGGDSRSIQSVLPGSGSYNPAVSNTPGKVVSGIKFNWYSDNWQIGAARSGATSVDGFVISRNNTSTVVITANGALAFGLPTSYGSSGQILQSNGDATPTWVSPGGITGVNADQVRTVAQTASATYYPTFVDSNNASNAYELVYTTSSFSINPSTGLITHAKTTVLGSSIAQGDPSATDITANATLLLSGVGGNYLSFGQKASNLAQWIQSGYSNPTTAVYPISLNPLGGNVGVGTLSPGARLEVYDSNNSTTVTAGIKVTNASATTNSAAGITFVNYDNYGGWIRSLRSGSSQGILTFGTNNGVGVGEANVIERVRIDSVGTVGIGETSPITYATSGSLVITNTTFRPELALRTTTAVGGTTAIKLGATSSIPQGGAVISSYISAVSGQPTDLIFSLVTSGSLTERLRITSNGGIAFSGSTSYGTSGQMLQSNGDAAPTWVALSSRTVGTSTQVNTVLQTGNTTYYPTFVDSNNASATAESLYTTSSFTVNAQSGSISMTGPLRTEFYGVDNSTPSDVLNIIGVGASRALGTGPALLFSAPANTDGTNMWALARIMGTGDNGSTGDANGAMYLQTRSLYNPGGGGSWNWRTNMVLRASGNVGFGTSAPATKLSATSTRHGNADGLSAHLNSFQWEVSGQGYTSVVSNISSSAGNYNAGLLVKLGSTDATDKILDLESGGVNRVRVLGNGNVGIGVTGPSHKLEVAGATTYSYAQGSYSSGATLALRAASTTANDYTGIRFVNSNGSREAFFGVVQGSTSAIGDFVFQTYSAATTSYGERMRVMHNGNVIIGGSGSTATNKFEVAGTAGQLFSVSDSFTGTIFSANDVSGIPSIEVLDTGLVKMAQYGGQVAINTGTVASSTASLSVYGMIYTMGTLGEIRASSEITAYFSSDRRLKENIKLIENPITIIDQIRGVTFDWTAEHMARRGGEDGYFVRKHDIGVIAQEVQAVLPELVGTREDGYLAVKYEKLVPLLIEAIKSQQKTIDSLVNDLADVKAFINQLKNNQ